MKLHSNPASPYGRKVKVVAHETGLFPRLSIHNLQTSAVGPDLALVADNPLGKIPCLVLDNGGALYDSRVICEYLDTLHQGARLFPAGGAERWEALRLQALADGIMDAALLTRYETFLRPEALRWTAWVDGQLDKVAPRPGPDRGRGGAGVRWRASTSAPSPSPAPWATSISASPPWAGASRDPRWPSGTRSSPRGPRCSRLLLPAELTPTRANALERQLVERATPSRVIPQTRGSSNRKSRTGAASGSRPSLRQSRGAVSP